MAIRPGDTPVPIPNTTVKARPAEGTALETVWESRWPPEFKKLINARKQNNCTWRILYTGNICTLKTAYTHDLADNCNRKGTRSKTIVHRSKAAGTVLRRQRSFGTLQLTQRKRKTSQMETSVNEVKVTKKDIERYPG